MSIHIKKSHEGLMHRDRGKPEGQKLTEADIQAEKHSSDPAERKRGTFAENARHWNHHGAVEGHIKHHETHGHGDHGHD